MLGTYRTIDMAEQGAILAEIRLFLNRSLKVRICIESSCNLIGRIRLGPIRNKNNWNNASKRLFGSYSHSRIPGFPFRLFCSQEQNSRNIFRNIFLFRHITNERALSGAQISISFHHLEYCICIIVYDFLVISIYIVVTSARYGLLRAENS